MHDILAGHSLPDVTSCAMHASRFGDEYVSKIDGMAKRASSKLCQCSLKEAR